MRVVDVRDFCVPSDENDYDELVAFADAMAGVPQFDAVPIDVLDKIRAEIEQKLARAKQMSSVLQMNAYTDCLQIIDKYKTESEEV